MSKKMGMAALALACAIGTGALAGCSQETPQPEPAPAQASEEAKAEPAADESPEPEGAVIGKESEDAYRVQLTNDLGADVTSLSIKDSSEESFPSSMIGADEKVAAGETVTMFYAPEQSVAADAPYDMLVGIDGKTYELHGLELGNWTEMTLALSGDIAYATYVDADGKTGDTKQVEQDVLDAKKAAAEEEAAQKAAEEEAVAAEEAAAAEAAQAEAAAEEAEAATAAEMEEAPAEPEYVEPEYAEPAYVEPEYVDPGYYEAPAQGEDSCVDGGVVLR
ncbi:hypothetical protein GMI69_10470 [Eggerthellaceae bacterium zg-887]|uniref:hypothetical protein n=1 Tax=Xiamenia xianingshaonis TaxID=2682776 RepID=UPI001409F34A|nr:hypothetical protein [Xiamenia xianingshaonis]NHM17054.1 hypothetical protein [Xiamenia xianingshaonis]